MGSESAENDYLADVLGSTDIGHEWARNNGYIHEDDLKVELQALKERAESDIEMVSMVWENEQNYIRYEKERFETYIIALEDISKKFNISLE